MKEPRLGRIWLINVGQETAGYAILAYGFSLEYGGRNAFLDELYVVPEFRGKGIGRRTIASLERFARKENLAAIHLEVSHNNSGALRLYGGAGFQDHGRYLLTKWLDS